MPDCISAAVSNSNISLAARIELQEAVSQFRMSAGSPDKLVQGRWGKHRADEYSPTATIIWRLCVLETH